MNIELDFGDSDYGDDHDINHIIVDGKELKDLNIQVVIKGKIKLEDIGKILQQGIEKEVHRNIRKWKKKKENDKFCKEFGKEIGIDLRPSVEYGTYYFGSCFELRIEKKKYQLETRYDRDDFLYYKDLTTEEFSTVYSMYKNSRKRFNEGSFKLEEGREDNKPVEHLRFQFHVTREELKDAVLHLMLMDPSEKKLKQFIKKSI